MYYVVYYKSKEEILNCFNSTYDVIFKTIGHKKIPRLTFPEDKKRTNWAYAFYTIEKDMIHLFNREGDDPRYPSYTLPIEYISHIVDERTCRTVQTF